MVDPWRSLEGWNKPFNVSNEQFAEVYNQAVSNTEAYKDKIRILRNETRSAMREIADGSLDMAYVDGDHTLRGVTIDLISAYEKVRPGGYLAGDDFTQNIWQHGRKFEPTLVCPFAVYFAEAVDAAIFILPFNQFVMQKPFSKDGGFSLKSYIGGKQSFDLLSRM